MAGVPIEETDEYWKLFGELAGEPPTEEEIAGVKHRTKILNLYFEDYPDGGGDTFSECIYQAIAWCIEHKDLL